MSSLSKALLAALGCVVALSAQGQQAPSVTVYTEQGQLTRGAQNVTTLGHDLLGDKVNLFTGSLEFSQTDVDLPGNNALPVALQRRHSAGRDRYIIGHFGDWDLDIPRLQAVYTSNLGWINGAGATNRCSNYSAPPNAVGNSRVFWYPEEYWQGNFLHAPGSGGEEVLRRSTSNLTQPSDGYSYPLVTRAGWQIRCLPSLANGPGEGFVAVAPNGNEYRFDWMVSRLYPAMRDEGNTFLGRREFWILPTTVTDRFGNSVSYTYDSDNPWRLKRMQASDGRFLSLSYTTLATGAGVVQSVTDGMRTWSYEYRSNGELSRVVQPDASAWEFNLGGLVPLMNYQGEGATCDWVGDVTTDEYSGTIKHPSGTLGTFKTRFDAHGRAGVVRHCIKKYSPPESRSYAQWPKETIAQTLVSKTLSGPGVNPSTWNYSYISMGSWEPCNGCDATRKVIVTDPRGYKTRYVYGTLFQVNEGQLLQEDQGWDGSSAQRTVTSAYQAPAGMSYPEPVGFSLSEVSDYLAARHRPVNQRLTTQQGSTFSWQANSFDARARPLSVTKSSSLGTSRTEVTVYHDNLTHWVLGQVASVTDAATGLVMGSMSYNASTALPERLYRFGKLQSSYGFNNDGTLASVADGKNQTTRYGDYKRGLAQRIDYPDNSYQTAQISDIGLITSVTDALGYTTSYGYDEIGRLSRITPPSGWSETLLDFEPVPFAEYGLDAGHWRQIISKGNARTVTHFDALWRPVLTRKFDQANENGTRSVVVKQFDIDGRVTAQSYPQRADVTSVLNAVTGQRSSYDALGRPYAQQADSELGVLNSTTEYLTGFQTRLTNPRGKATTQSFWALDNPAEAQLAAITLPAGVSVNIARDGFGKPTSITRSGSYGGTPVSVTRSYVYDAHQRPCKTIEPEVGATIQDYDEAGNIAWRASGQALTAGNNCDSASVPASAKITHGYDALNRLTSTSYGDGSPAVTRTYTVVGQLQTLSSNGSTWTYGYNSLRQLNQETLAYAGQNYGFSHSFNSDGNLSALTYPSGATVTYSPNALGQPQSVSGYASNISHHPNGAVAGYTLANGIVHTQTQNLRGLPLQNRDAGVLQDLYAYDANGNVTSITDQQEAAFHRAMGYDDLDRLTSVSAPSVWGNATYTYDPVDNLRSAVVGSRNSSFGYDGTNRLVSALTNGGSTQYGYDALGNLRSKGGQTFSFDIGNRLSASSLGGSYAYDGHGRRIRIVDTNGSARVQVYSQAGQLLWATRSGATVPAAVNYECPAGTTLSGSQCLSTSTATTIVTYSCPSGYTRTNDQCSITTQSSIPATPIYSCANGAELINTQCRVTTSVAATPVYSCPNGYQLNNTTCTRATYVPALGSSHDCKGRGSPTYDMESSAYFCTKQFVATENPYEAEDQCRAIASGYGLVHLRSEFVYEGLYRCVIGAVTTLNCPAGTVAEYPSCRGTETQAASHSGYTCSTGELSGSSCLIRTTSPASVSFHCPGGGTLSNQACYKDQVSTIAAQRQYSCPAGYTLQADNSCRSTSSSAATPVYSCPNGGHLSDTNCVGVGQSTTQYVYLGAKQIAETVNGLTQYAHTDALGSPVARTNASGALLNRTRYEPYGYVAQGTKPGAATSVIGFTGHVQDGETDLVYMQQRYYDPIAGRFLSVDPVVTDANTGKGFGLYTYVDNNPYAKVDPDGRVGELFWTASDKATLTIKYTMTGVASPVSAAAINAQVAADFSGSTSIGGKTVTITAQGVNVSAAGPGVNTINVVKDTAGVTASGRSETNAIGGSNVTIGATGPNAANVRTVSHELGHAVGAGDQYKGGVGASGATLGADVAGPANVMKDLSGQPANKQTLGEIIKAPTNTNSCAKGVSAASGAC